MKQLALDLEGVSVMIGIPCGPSLPWQTVSSLLKTTMALSERGIPHEVRLVVGCAIVEQARAKVAHEYLAGSMNRLFMIDSDIVWEPQDFIRLLGLSTLMEMVGGIYTAKREPPEFFMRHPAETMETNEYGCLPISGMGLGFTIATRRVMEALAEKAPKVVYSEATEPWARVYRCEVEDGTFVGEDMAFFADVAALGVQPWLDPAITLGHAGSKVYSASIREAMTKFSDKETQ